MNQYIILLRGVNVGGKNLLPMKALKVIIENAGFSNVKTYIQSGNIILSGEEPREKDIALLIHDEFGFTPQIIVLSEADFISAVSNNPYKNYEGKLVHFYFCKNKPNIDEENLAKLTSAQECHELVGNVFYLHAPDGIGRSGLVANIESCLGVPATGRNLNTINKLNSMLLH